MGAIEGIKTLFHIVLLSFAALYIGVVALYAIGFVIGIGIFFSGQIVGLGLAAMCGFLLWSFTYLPMQLSKDH